MFLRAGADIVVVVGGVGHDKVERVEMGKEGEDEVKRDGVEGVVRGRGCHVEKNDECWLGGSSIGMISYGVARTEL